MRRGLASALAFALGASALLGDVAQAVLPAPSLRPPLTATVWMCKPGMPANSCGQDAAGNPTDPAPTGHYADGRPTTLDATAVSPSGATTTEPLPARLSPPIDCFYVYPTVDLLSNPALKIGSNPPVRRDTETSVLLAQVGRFAGQCRIFAPLYRQATLVDYLLGLIVRPDFETGLADVKQAFLDYWNHDSVDPATGKRRGIVFIGHSQGAGVLKELIRQRFDGTPDSAQLVAAYLLGGDVTVPLGAPSGGGNDPVSAFQHLPACSRAGADAPIPTGCVVGYSSHGLESGALPTGGFGRAPDPQHEQLCVNPAALLTGVAPGARTPIATHLPTRQLLRGSALAPTGSLGFLLGDYRAPAYPTGFATYPGQVTGQCSSVIGPQGRLTWLQVTGLEKIKVSRAGGGLHTIDANVASGDLVALLGAQSRAWAATH